MSIEESERKESSQDPDKHENALNETQNTGPWYHFPIINNLPDDIEISVIESYEEHIYIGTSSGEILHFFEIEFGNYLLVSRTNFDDDISKRQPAVNKIIILPKIEKACILSDSEVILFLLPEMAPVPNVERLKGINDIVLKDYPKKDDNKFKNKYELLLFRDSKVTNLVITENEFKQNTTFDYKFIQSGQCHDSMVMSAKLNNYELLNLKYNQVISLFRISESVDGNNNEATLKPMIRSFNNDSFLVCSGGASYEDNAMVLVVDHHGDITGIAMELEHYPIDLIVSYPYLLVQYKDDQFQVYKFLDDQKLTVQKVEVPDTRLRIFKTRNTTKPSIKPNSDDYETYLTLRDAMVDKLMTVPISNSSSTTTYDMEYKKKELEAMCDFSSSILITDSSSIYSFIPKPLFLTIVNFEKSQIDLIHDYLKNCEELNLKSKISNLERKYLILLILLLNMLHCDKIDIELVNMWCDRIKSIDIRLFLDLLGFETYGKPYIYKGLKSIYENLKSLTLRNKTENTNEEFIKFFETIKKRLNNLIERQRNTIQDFENIIITIDVLLFNTLFANSDQQESGFDINEYNTLSHGEIIRIIKEDLIPKDTSNNNLLIQIYEQKGLFNEAVCILRSNMDSKSATTTNQFFEFIKSHIEQLPKEYISTELSNDLAIIMENLSMLLNKRDLHRVVRSALDIFREIKMDVHILLQGVEVFENGTFIKVIILEEINFGKDERGSTEDIEFLVRYYIEKMHSEIVTKTLWDKFKSFQIEYRSDHNYDKLPINEYLLTKIKFDSSCDQFVKLFEKIIRINDNMPSTSKLLQNEITKFDDNHILFILFFFTESYNDTIDEKVRLNILIENNAFLEIQSLVNSTNIVRLFDQYCNELDDVDLAIELLKRNKILLEENITNYFTILGSIPKQSSFHKSGSLILNILINRQTKLEELEIKKSLLKNEVSIYNDILKKLDT
ncbi:similar to Saccharomyces cerevisiae YDR495C VPS3 Component of CORVET tethering complex [Maudiozyma saulgeensis]|uniref:Similar to Saccharomyces cerevisiae YDR495C VPS3 Component of CORVET tethering complex n=1 Tax=Maudiozyma saulgeensis TaxID=1789683 RepID=A0A1X7R1H4_9SACH|nr:similar to Saccharomyces cerevisiae YDR495C VPS3 Component of CORVET tethering complex [Kazachstania saulgeensis]